MILTVGSTYLNNINRDKIAKTSQLNCIGQNTGLATLAVVAELALLALLALLAVLSPLLQYRLNTVRGRICH
jgi:hypothetical protein